MSRSYRKHPILKDNGKSAKAMKKCANRKVRRTDFDDLPQKGSKFKRYFPQYDIHDYVCYWSWKEAKRQWETSSISWYKDRFPTLKEFFAYWVKSMKCK